MKTKQLTQDRAQARRAKHDAHRAIWFEMAINADNERNNRRDYNV